MKKSVFAFLAASLCLAACQIEIVDPNVSDDVLSAQIEQKEVTKTVLGESNNVLWSENDQIVAFMKSSFGHKYQIKPSFAGKTYAYFSRISSANGDDLAAGMEWDHNVAYYPYSESIECVKSGDNYALEVVLPAEQTYEANSFGNGTWPMVAVSEDNNITFKNVCGGIKLQLKGTQIVKSITIQGKNNEKLAGAATVTAYTDETKPAIVMAQSASTSVTLNCGSGVQLSESTATEFIIALPPVLFGQGFTVTVSDFGDNTYTVETDKANTVLRSNLLVMPAVVLDDSGEGTPEEDEEELVIPVLYVNLNSSSLTLYVSDKAQLTATVVPKDATDKTVVWSSSDTSVAIVDQTGLVTAVSEGCASIYAIAGGMMGKCSVSVKAKAIATADYIDEYGVNHGKGTAIGMAVWAPVNCGYHVTDYQWGKLYQWGRKYGQGFDDDATVPQFSEGGVSEVGGNHKSNSNVFYIGSSDWVYPRNDKLWNDGSESFPAKTAADPCPKGWRVPTFAELSELCQNHSEWTKNLEGYPGRWYSGTSSYTEKASRIFLYAAGKRAEKNVHERGCHGFYYSSTPSYDWADSEVVYILMLNDVYTYGSYSDRANGMSVRCVQE